MPFVLLVNDVVNAAVIESLSEMGIKLIALRAAGYNNVDLNACKSAGISVVRVPAYSPYAVAEHAVALMLSLNRKIHKAYQRTTEQNFSLDGLLGFDMYGKTAGVVGTGKIGKCCINILVGFGMKVLCFDPYKDKEILTWGDRGVHYVDNVEDLWGKVDIITLHVPLLDSTRHMVNEKSIGMMKDGVMLINTSRGELIDTNALIEGLKNRKIGSAGLDVYEEEKEWFFQDHSEDIVTDTKLVRLTTFPNVILTGHQAFFTKEALTTIADTTLNNVRDFVGGKLQDKQPNVVKQE